MRIASTSPEITMLREAAEQRLGIAVLTPRHFTMLSQDIEDRVSEYLSETTLQRLWQYKKGYGTVAVHTLNVLSRYVGLPDWSAFCQGLKENSRAESYLFGGSSLDIDSLAPGTLVRISWRPDRVCTVKYLGDHRFEAIETLNSKLSAGDTFTCHHMQIGREMFLDHLVRGCDDMSYVIGTRNGLTSLSILGSK